MSALGRMCFLLIMLCSLALLPERSALAQNAASAPQPVIRHVENHTTAQGANPIAPPSDQTGGQLHFQNSPINPILDLYEQLSGKHLIRDANVNGLPPVSINVSGLNKDETLKLISATLLLNNVAIIPVDAQTAKVVTIGINKNPRSEGVRLYTAEGNLPSEDQIVSYYMPLDHIPAGEAVGIFQQVAPPHPTYGGYVPAPSANGVVITENSSVVRELIALKKLIDVRRPSGGPPRDHPPGKGGPFVLIILLILMFAAGYFYGRRRLRKKLAVATS